MDYTIWNSDLTQYNVTEDVNVFIGNTVPLALREQFIIRKHPEVFWSKLLGKPVPSSMFRITLSALETMSYDPSDDIYGREIHFDITIHELVYDDSVTKNPLSQIPFLAETIILLIVGAILLVLYALYRRYSHLFVKTKKCTVCKAAAEGKCMKCGIIYCRNCFFDKGCPECHSNQFKPL